MTRATLYTVLFIQKAPIFCDKSYIFRIDKLMPWMRPKLNMVCSQKLTGVYSYHCNRVANKMDQEKIKELKIILSKKANTLRIVFPKKTSKIILKRKAKVLQINPQKEVKVLKIILKKKKHVLTENQSTELK